MKHFLFFLYQPLDWALELYVLSSIPLLTWKTQIYFSRIILDRAMQINDAMFTQNGG